MPTKGVCEDPVRMIVDKKQKIKKIHGKEPDQSNCQLSGTTVTNKTIEESKNKICVAFKKKLLIWK